MPSSTPGPSGGAVRPGAPLPAPRIAPELLLPPQRRSSRHSRRRGIPRAISLYLAGEILQYFAAALLVIILVYASVIAFQLVRDGIRVEYVWPHLLHTCFYPLFFAIPLSFLIGITLGAGRLAHDRELSALRAQGVSHLELAAPVAALAILFGALDYYLCGWVLPDVHYEHANLRETILEQLHHLGSGSNRTILLPGNVSLFVKRYEGLHLDTILLDVPAEQSEALAELGELAQGTGRRRLTGGRIQLAALQANLEVAPDRSQISLWLDGVHLLLPEEVQTSRGRDVFHQSLTVAHFKLPLSFDRKGESARDMKNPALREFIRDLRSQARGIEEALRSSSGAAAAKERPAAAGGEGIASGPAAEEDLDPEALRKELASLNRKALRAEIELQGRFTFSLACLTFPLLAFSLVVLGEDRGRLHHFFLGNLAVVMVFFPLVMTGQLLADRGWSPWLTMALPNLVLLVIGSALARMVASR